MQPARLNQALLLYKTSQLRLWPFIMEITYSGFLILTFPLLILMNMIGDLYQISYYFNTDLCTVLLYFSQLFFLYALIVLFIKKKITFKNDLFIVLFFYCFMSSLSPLTVHRYLLPIYPIMIILICSDTKKDESVST